MPGKVKGLTSPEPQIACAVVLRAASPSRTAGLSEKSKRIVVETWKDVNVR